MGDRRSPSSPESGCSSPSPSWSSCTLGQWLDRKLGTAPWLLIARRLPGGRSQLLQHVSQAHGRPGARGRGAESASARAADERPRHGREGWCCTAWRASWRSGWRPVCSSRSTRRRRNGEAVLDERGRRARGADARVRLRADRSPDGDNAIAGWGLGAVICFVALVVYGFVSRALGLPSNAALLSLATFLLLD